MLNCLECLERCSLHNVTRCLTCHDHPGECSWGGCTRNATHLVDHPKEKRPMCREHATAGWTAFSRVGATVEVLA